MHLSCDRAGQGGTWRVSAGVWRDSPVDYDAAHAAVGTRARTGDRCVKILEVRTLAIPELKVVRFERFRDERGYLTEPYRRSDLDAVSEVDFVAGVSFPQTNESYSRAGVVRGLHFQWSPFIGKLARAITGRMVDLALDIRPDSPTLGKIVAYDLPASPEAEWSEWIWVPPGFAHGNFFTEDTVIEYLCTGEYSPESEAGISPLASDLDWSLCDDDLRREFEEVVRTAPIISDKDRGAASLSSWLDDTRSAYFRYSELIGAVA
jgi:dTDP-4-dehydrorhamnose 3,5-epimerase